MLLQPEELVQSIISRLKEFGADTIEELQGLEENMFFEVPKELRIKKLINTKGLSSMISPFVFIQIKNFLRSRSQKCGQVLEVFARQEKCVC